MAIIPLPEKIEYTPGVFKLSLDTHIITDADNRWNAEYLQRLLAPPTGFKLPIGENADVSGNAIQLRLNFAEEKQGSEGYRLEATPAGIIIIAASTTGVFYGIQSLRQLLPVEVEERQPILADWSIPAQIITDRPRFAWRGFMLDEGRHFQGIKTVLLLLDLMALLKLNVFHWHLTEDQGWRIEIKRYPRLTDVGSVRSGTSSAFIGKKHNGVQHGGFYSQEEIHRVVEYAAERHITIVPEIELPGHCTAALAAYPELSCSGGPFEVSTHFGVFPDIYCAGKEATFTFIENVLDEILELFPSPFIHIGGDEAPKVRWKKCPDCQKRIKDEGLEDEHALQVYFTNRIMAYLDSKGRHGLGWNEILHEGLIEGAAVQFWVGGREDLLKALHADRRPVIMSTYLDTYLDHSYGLTPLSRAYRYEPVPQELEEKEAISILGVEFPLWSEWVSGQARLDYQAFPRLMAGAEVGWTPRECKDLKDFRIRLQRFLPRLDRLGVKYAPLKEVEPSWLVRLFGIFTIAIPQRKTARQS